MSAPGACVDGAWPVDVDVGVIKVDVAVLGLEEREEVGVGGGLTVGTGVTFVGGLRVSPLIELGVPNMDVLLWFVEVDPNRLGPSVDYDVATSSRDRLLKLNGVVLNKLAPFEDTVVETLLKADGPKLNAEGADASIFAAAGLFDKNENPNSAIGAFQVLSDLKMDSLAFDDTVAEVLPGIGVWDGNRGLFDKADALELLVSVRHST